MSQFVSTVLQEGALKFNLCLSLKYDWNSMVDMFTHVF